MKKTIHLLTLVLLGGILVGCNLPNEQKSEEAPPGAVFTAAAETVSAKFTADAAALADAQPVILESSTNTPIPPSPEPTNSPQPTATSTPTQTSTPTENPDAIFEDDFSDTTGWYAALNDDYGFEYTDGGYRIYNNILSAGIWSVRYQEFGDIRLDVDVIRKSGPDDGYFGVVCRFGDDGMDYYALVVSDNGFYGILKMEDGDDEFLESGIDEDEKIHRGIGAVNRIGGACSGNQLTLYANDHQLLEIFDDTFLTGDIGIIAGNRMTDPGIDVLFDNFAILWP